MRKIFALLLCAVSLFVVACKKGDDGYIEDIDIENSFYEQTIYVGDEIDFSEYSFIVSYNTGEMITIDYSMIEVEGFSTAEEGEHELTFKYKNKKFKKTYMVYEPAVISCTYKGGAIVYYKGDNQSVSEVEFVALYENGNEKKVSLSEASIVGSASLSEAVTNVAFEYRGKSFLVPCSVTYKPIQKDVEYKFVDNTNGYIGENYKIVFSGTKAYVYINDREQANEFTVTEGNYNRYTSLRSIGGAPVIIELYLINDTIYMDIPE